MQVWLAGFNPWNSRKKKLWKKGLQNTFLTSLDALSHAYDSQIRRDVQSWLIHGNFEYLNSSTAVTLLPKGEGLTPTPITWETSRVPPLLFTCHHAIQTEEDPESLKPHISKHCRHPGHGNAGGMHPHKTNLDRWESWSAYHLMRNQSSCPTVNLDKLCTGQWADKGLHCKHQEWSLSSRRPNSSAEELKRKGCWRYLCPGGLKPPKEIR